MPSESLNYSDWIKKVEDDLSWAIDSLGSGHYLGVCFLAQQIVEKILKAYLLFKNQHLRKIHDLLTLLKMCQKFEEDFSQFETSCADISQFYVESRYPDLQFVASEKTATAALQKAREIVDFVLSKINNSSSK